MTLLLLSSDMQSQKDNYDKYHNTAHGRIRIWFGIRQIMNSTPRLLIETRDAATQLKTGIHMVPTPFLFYKPFTEKQEQYNHFIL